MRRLCVSLVGLLAMTSLAEAGGSRAVHVMKRTKSLSIRVYWAQYLTETEIQVYPFPYGAEIGDRFDVADERGYMGRVTVTRVEQQQAGCGGVTIYLATARYDQLPNRTPVGNLIAFSPDKRAPGRARIMTPSELREGPADPPAGGSGLEIVLDWDGDQNPDLLRYYYSCASQPGGQLDSYCMDTFQRLRREWRRTETFSMKDCY